MRAEGLESGGWGKAGIKPSTRSLGSAERVGDGINIDCARPGVTVKPRERAGVPVRFISAACGVSGFGSSALLTLPITEFSVEGGILTGAAGLAGPEPILPLMCFGGAETLRVFMPGCGFFERVMTCVAGEAPGLLAVGVLGSGVLSLSRTGGSADPDGRGIGLPFVVAGDFNDVSVDERARRRSRSAA